MAEKDQIVQSLVRARTDLETALNDLEGMPAFDPSLVSFIAHGLENFLHVTMATTELMQWSLKDNPDPDIRIYLEGLRHATSLMGHSVNQLMNVGVSNETRFRFEKVDMGILGERACAFYSRRAQRKNIRIIYSSPDEGPLVWTDRIAVAAVLDNLLSNAVKFSPDGSTIWLDVRTDQRTVICSVRDQGIGLSKEDQGRLFQRGVRLSAVPTAGEPSSGYGLAVAKELLDHLGGEIWCESELHHGARFSFRLPIYAEPSSLPS